MSKIDLSVVVPVYRGESTVRELAERICKVAGRLVAAYEVILVDDRSPDQVWPVLQQLAKAIPQVRVLRLSRNFGQHVAITAGLDASRGERVVVMDCDLQDIPEEIEKLYRKSQEGFEVVMASRVERQDGILKRFSSWLFYRVLSFLVGETLDPRIANYGIYHRKAIQVLTGQMREAVRYFPMLIRWTGFRYTTVPVRHAESERGGSSYTFGKLLHLAINVILAFTDRPLRLVLGLGCGFILISFGMAIWVSIYYLLGRITVLGWPSLMISVWFIGGVILFVLGVLGLYLGKTFEQVKGRPIYIIDESLS